MTKHTKFGLAIAILSVTALNSLSALQAHEYWIEPTNFTVQVDQEVQANLKVGANLKGQPLSYIPQFTVGYQLSDANGMRNLEGKAGDRPALVFTPEQAGLNIITYQTTRNRVSFGNWQKFVDYVHLQGMTGAVERHVERGLPQSDFAERYSRFAKALILVGDEIRGQDRATGMKVELVAVQNPYALSRGDELSIQLLYLDQPLADNQVSVFVQDQFQNSKIEISRIRTDENGQVIVQVQPGKMYMLNAIKLVEVEDEGNLAWESFWASLTFAIPE